MAREIKKKLEKQDWYISLINDCKAILTKGIWSSRWTLVKTYHRLGKRILKEYDNFKKWGITDEKEIRSHVTKDLKQSDRTIRRAVQFARTYPDLDLLPGGKNTSWHKICNELLPKPKEEEIPLPEGKFQVIYMDIPWDYDIDLTSGATREPDKSYSVMTLDEIKKFGEKVKNLAYKDCVLFMWITAPKLNWMNEVLEAFGFEYKTNIIWDKVKPVMRHYSAVSHEILIIAGKGKSAPLCDGRTIQSIDSVQVIPKSGKHSEKPEKFREIIEKLYPNTRKIELFARGKPKKGWTAWGEEVDHGTL